MEKIVIITDSNCDIPQNMLMDNIRVIPSTIVMEDGTEYLDSSLSKYNFSCSLNTNFKPISILLDVSLAINIMESLDKDVTGIIYIASSSMLNYNNRVLIEDVFRSYSLDHINSMTCIVDSNTTSMALGLLVLDAATMAKKGYCFDDIVSYICQNRNRYCMEFIPEYSEYLDSSKVVSSRKSKKIKENKKSYLYRSTILGLFKPVLSRKSNEEVKMIMMDRLVDKYSGRYAIVSSPLNKEADLIQEKLTSYILEDPIVSDLSCNNLVQMGTNTIALCYKKK